MSDLHGLDGRYVPIQPVARAAADTANPLVVRMMGANTNRRTVENVRLAGIAIERVEDLWRGIVLLIVARPNKNGA